MVPYLDRLIVFIGVVWQGKTVKRISDNDAKEASSLYELLQLA